MGEANIFHYQLS